MWVEKMGRKSQGIWVKWRNEGSTLSTLQDSSPSDLFRSQCGQQAANYSRIDWLHVRKKKKHHRTSIAKEMQQLGNGHIPIILCKPQRALVLGRWLLRKPETDMIINLYVQCLIRKAIQRILKQTFNNVNCDASHLKRQTFAEVKKTCWTMLSPHKPTCSTSGLRP